MDTQSAQLQKPEEPIQENQAVVSIPPVSPTTVIPPVPSQPVIQQPLATAVQQASVSPPSSTEPPVTPVPPTKPPQEQPVVSTSHLPEHEPIPSVGTNEWMKLSEPEVVLPDEVVEAGVETVPVTPSITTSQQAAGVMPAKESTPVQIEPTEEFHFPFTLPQTEEIIHKDKDIRDSLRWLALLIFREIAMARRKKQVAKTTV